MPAVQRKPIVTAIAQMGRISSRFPNGRPVEKVWLAPVITYPRPRSERSADVSGFQLGLHTEWDKWPADTVWNPRIKVMHGALPYRVMLANEKVDGVAAATGITYSQFVEDHTGTSPYLRLRHAGFTAPSAGTKLIEFTIQIHTPAGETVASVDVVLTIYARDHASFTTHFCVYDTNGSSGANGTGTFASPKTVLSGGLANGNTTLVGSDWNGNGTSVSKTRIALFIGNGVVKMATGMVNQPEGGDANAWFVGYQGPRQLIALEGASPIYEVEASVSGGIRPAGQRDVTMRGFTIRAASGTTSNYVFYSWHWYRVHAMDIHLQDIHVVNSGANGAPFKSATDPGFYGSLSHVTADNVFTNEDGANLASICNIFERNFCLIEHVTVPASQFGGTQRLYEGVRMKHASTDCEMRFVTALGYTGSTVPRASGLASSTDIGTHTRLVIRGNNVHNANRAYFMMVADTPGVYEGHSVMYHHNVFKGPISHGTRDQPTIPNNSEFHASGNLVENSSFATNTGWGTMDVDYKIAFGKTALIEKSISGAIGSLVDTNGVPLNAAHVGVYGPTAIAA